MQKDDQRVRTGSRGDDSERIQGENGNLQAENPKNATENQKDQHD